MKAIDASNAAGAVDPSSMSPESESESLEDKAARNAFPSLAILPYVPATSFRPASKYGIEPILRSFSRSLFSSSRTERKTHVGASSGERGTAEGSGLPEPGVCTYTNIAGPYNASSLHFRGHACVQPATCFNFVWPTLSYSHTNSSGQLTVHFQWLLLQYKAPQQRYSAWTTSPPLPLGTKTGADTLTGTFKKRESSAETPPTSTAKSAGCFPPRADR